MFFEHDELCMGGVRAPVCDCDFILKIRKNQIERDVKIISSMKTKGNDGKWLLRWKAISSLYQQLVVGAEKTQPISPVMKGLPIK